MKARALTVRAIALLAAGSAAVHQLRYAIGYGHGAGHALAAQGHAYLDAALPFVAAVAVVALGAMLRSTALAGPRSLRRTWLLASCALVGAYVAQELIEGVVAAGHPAGLVGVFGAGGWSAAVLAVPVGLFVALGMGGGDALASLAETIRALAPERVFVCASAPVAGMPGASVRLRSARAPPLLSVR